MDFRQMWKNRKGLADETALVIFVLSLIGVVISIGVGVLVLDAFNGSTTNAKAQGVFGNGTDMFSNFTGQLPTIGTIGGILLLVVLITLVGIGGYSYGREKGWF